METAWTQLQIESWTNQDNFVRPNMLGRLPEASGRQEDPMETDGFGLDAARSA
jgi:hypothetical protein